MGGAELSADARDSWTPVEPVVPPIPSRAASEDPNGPVVGRFAPTPSGRMHVGNAYAMLAAWLSARSAGTVTGRGSRMILRIEDIDTPRVVKDADRWIMDDLDWLGLDWDGEPVYQSSRLDRYEEIFEMLRACGLVYPCFCSRADIRAASAPNEGDGFVVYSGTCRRLAAANPAEARRRMAAGDRHSWRIAMPDGSRGSGMRGDRAVDVDERVADLAAQVPAAPQTAVDVGGSSALMTFDDRMFGPQRFDLTREVGDTVIRRSDGIFAYQLAVTVDDLDMGVTDIVRGRDLLRSTALQLAIRERLDFPDQQPLRPAFAHLPLIDNAQGRRMAKREHSLDLGFLRARGVRPEQVVGYCAWLLGLRPATSAASQPVPMTAAEALEAFTAVGGWNGLRGDLADRTMPDRPAALEPDAAVAV